VRRSFDIGQYLQGLLPCCGHAVEKFNSLMGEVILELFDLNRQQSESFLAGGSGTHLAVPVPRSLSNPHAHC
jgi:hypothetical protein